MIEKVLGAKAAPIRTMLESTHPDLARMVTEFAYGEVYARPGLGLPERELLAVCCLTMLNLKPQLKTHVYGALNVGVTRAQLEEAFLHIALYAGFPAALSGMLTAREVFAEIDAKPPGKRRKRAR
jgi:4-carboxymuconolactone decarboxylase